MPIGSRVGLRVLVFGPGSRPHRGRPRVSFECMEYRLAMSHLGAPHPDLHGPAVVEAMGRETNGPKADALRGDVNGDGRVDLPDLQAMAAAYLSVRGQPRYNPVADLNGDGKVNQYDARLLEKLLPKPAPGTPLNLVLRLAPGQEVAHPGTVNSGANTHLTDVTIVGKTIPGALVFADGVHGVYRFNGPLLPTDAQGYFTDPVHLKGPITLNTTFLVIDQFGRQLVRTFPIRLI